MTKNNDLIFEKKKRNDYMGWKYVGPDEETISKMLEALDEETDRKMRQKVVEMGLQRA